MFSLSPRFRSDLILLLTALVWGSGFIAQRLAANHILPFLFNAGRFFLGGMLLLGLFRLQRGRGVIFTRRLLIWSALAGGVLFAGAAFQQAGMQFTTAANGGFITGLYVVTVPFLWWVFWKQPVGWKTWLAAGLAVVGAYLLSAGGLTRLSPGDGLVLGGVLFWALHIILVGQATRRLDVLEFSISQFLACAFLNLLSSLLFEPSPWDGAGQAALALLYSGVISVAVGYTLQVVGQQHAPPTDAAIILSMEAVFAALFGFLLLGESLSLVQVGGCGLILAAIVLAQVGGQGAVVSGQ